MNAGERRYDSVLLPLPAHLRASVFVCGCLFVVAVLAGCSDRKPAAPTGVAAEPRDDTSRVSPALEDGLEVDAAKSRLLLDAHVVRQDVYEELRDQVEYVAVFSGGKAYESLFVCDADPVACYEAMRKIGLTPGRPAEEVGGSYLEPAGARLRVTARWGEGDERSSSPVESFVRDTVTGKPMAPAEWVFTGSREGWDPETEKTVLQVAIARNLMALHYADPTVLIQHPDPELARQNRYRANRQALPPEGTPVKLILEAVRPAAE